MKSVLKTVGLAGLFFLIGLILGLLVIIIGVLLPLILPFSLVSARVRNEINMIV